MCMANKSMHGKDAQRVGHQLRVVHAGDGSLRLSKGVAGPGFEYGRLEIFLNGLWSDICSNTQFTPNSASVACRILGYDGGSRLLFTIPYEPYIVSFNLIRQNLYTVCEPDGSSLKTL